MYRFDSKKGFYIYPYKSNESKSEHETFHLLEGVSGWSNRRDLDDDISVVKLGIQIPEKADTFKEFETRMKTAEAKFKRLLDGYSCDNNKSF